MGNAIETFIKTFSQDLIVFTHFSNQIDVSLLKNINSHY
jgi:hypothetical protein